MFRSVKYFDIIRSVIEGNIEAIASQRGVPRDEAYAQVVQHLRNNHDQWLSGMPPHIPYQDPFCRIAYLYHTVPANANLIEWVFANDPELQLHFDAVHGAKGQVAVCAFGGGPGTELLGLAKWVEQRQLGCQIAIDFLLLERVSEWLDSWRAIRREIDARFRANLGPDPSTWPLRLTGEFSPIDIASTADFANLGNVFGQDVHILSYIISEVFEGFQDMIGLASEMTKCAPRGAKFLFADRRGSRWKNEVRKLAGSAGLALSAFHDVAGSMSGEEQWTDLGQLCIDLGQGWQPRVTWNAFWVVGTKA